jgi:hypothetical protein
VIRRILSSLMVLLFAMQAFASGSTILICKMTGEVLPACCCKDEKTSDSVALSEASCCDVHRNEKAHLTGAVNEPSRDHHAVAVSIACSPSVVSLPPRPTCEVGIGANGALASDPIFLTHLRLLV